MHNITATCAIFAYLQSNGAGERMAHVGHCKDSRCKVQWWMKYRYVWSNMTQPGLLSMSIHRQMCLWQRAGSLLYTP